MKNSIYLFMSCLLLFASSCKKEEVTIYNPGEKEHGCVTALKNGEDFLASAFVHLVWQGANDDGLGVRFHTYDEDDVVRESFFLSMPREVGLYTTSDYQNNELMTISAHAGYYDEIDIVYEMDDSKNNYVDLQVLDLVTMNVEGTFEIFLKRTDGDREGHPKNLSLKDGHFIGTIIQ